jgi:hypothetical protein
MIGFMRIASNDPSVNVFRQRLYANQPRFEAPADEKFRAEAEAAAAGFANGGSQFKWSA